MASDFKFYPCESEALELLKKYHEGITRLHEKQTVLQKEYSEKLLENQKAAFAELGNLWRPMAAMAGLDPNVSSFSNPDYSVETKYLDKGFGGIVYQPRQRNPLEEMMGDQTDEPNDPDFVPDKKLLN